MQLALFLCPYVENQHMKFTILLAFSLLALSSFAQDEIMADVPFATIEQPPLYPGCNIGDNIAKKKCMSIKVQDFVLTHFNTKKFDPLNLPPGRKRIAVRFKISSEGNIIDVEAFAQHAELEKEAIRVINALPQMSPGIQRGRKVNVLYAIPIEFFIEPPSKRKNKKQTKKS